MFISLFSFSFIFPMNKKLSTEQKFSKIGEVLRKKKKFTKARFSSCLLGVGIGAIAVSLTKFSTRMHQESGSNTLAEIIVPVFSWGTFGMLSCLTMVFHQDEKHIEKQLENLEKEL